MSEILAFNWVFSFASILGSGMMWFIYRKNYRFATIFHDMLPFYPFLSVMNIVLFIFVALPIKGNEVFGSILYALILINLTIQLYVFSLWTLSYRRVTLFKALKAIKGNSEINIIKWADLEKDDIIKSDKINVVIRHDVDIILDRARKLAEIERSLAIPSCYLFRNNAERYSFDEGKELIEELQENSLFEIGFHYETISNAKGDLNHAVTLFAEELEEFNKYTSLRYIAAHGDKYRNKRLVDDNMLDLEQLKVKSCYYLGHDTYISDAGGLVQYNSKHGKIRFIDYLRRIPAEDKGTFIQVLLHSDWWF